MMINMIRADLYRIIRGKGIYIAFAVMVLMIAVDIYSIQAGSLGVHISTGTETENELSDMSYREFEKLGLSEYRKLMLETKNYKLDKDILAVNSNLYYIFIFVVAVIVAADFSGGCVKNTLSSAISKKKYFFSKLVCVDLCCMVFLFLNTYIMYFANLFCNNSNLASDLATVTRITLMQLPPMLVFCSLLTGFVFTLRSTAAFNTVAIPFLILIQMLTSFLSFILKIPDKVFEYELQHMIMRLANNPSVEYVLQSYLVCAAMIAGALLLGWGFFKKAEIK